jgi:glycosyltransferase involved in cell wall biosynthesis
LQKILLLGERWAVRYANEVIVISEVINQLIQKKHGRYDALIHNGVNEPRLLSELTIDNTLSRFGLQPKNYLVVVGRFVEEKGCMMPLPPINTVV